MELAVENNESVVVIVAVAVVVVAAVAIAVSAQDGVSESVDFPQLLEV